MKKSIFLLLALATLGFIGTAQSAIAEHAIRGNSVNYCQAFTPGPANTIRNRVIGAENVGATMNVACNFASLTNGAAGADYPKRLSVYFSNNSAAQISISCSLLTGYAGQSTGYLVTKTVLVAAGSVAISNLSWGPADNPTAGALNLGNSFIGINCTLPTGAVMNDTYLYWDMNNGV